jgi:hypothetical protein
MEKVMLPSGRMMLLEPKQAAAVRAKMAAIATKNRKIERELKASHLLPSTGRSGIAGALSGNYQQSTVEIHNLQSWNQSKKDSMNDQFAAFCKANLKAV